MPATLKRSLANRLNALRSTGPKTAEGKARSSRNARSHGLSRAVGAVPPPEWSDLIASRKSAWRAGYRPTDAAQEYLFDRLVVESVRLDQCEARIAAARIEFADRAAESWDDDRRAEVAQVASKLAGAPNRVLPLLLQSKHGVEWLLDAWEEVADSLLLHDEWTGPNWIRAMDLLGFSADARVTSSPFDIDPEDISSAPGLAFIRDVTDALRSRLADTLNARDSRARLDAELGLELTDPKPIRLLERYAADARRRVRWSIAELRTLQSSSPSTAAPSALAAPPGPRPDRRKPKHQNTLPPAESPARNEPIPATPPARNQPTSPEASTLVELHAPELAARNEPNPSRSPARNEPISHQSAPSSLPRTSLLPTSASPVLLNRRARRAQAAAAKHRRS